MGIISIFTFCCTFMLFINVGFEITIVVFICVVGGFVGSLIVTRLSRFKFRYRSKKI